MIGAGLRAEIGTKSRVTATLRFVITISTALLLSGLFHSPQLGGFAALGAFMALLSDTESDLISRLGGVAITFVGVMCAALLGVVLKNMEYGKWLVIALVCFGQNLVTFAEKFWWLWGKYVLVFLLISIFDFTPDLMAFVGYFVGFSLAMAAIVLDHFVWRYEKLSLRPMAQLKLVEGGNRNSYAYAVISTATLICALSCSFLFDFSEPGWVGITALYLLNSNVAAGYKRVVQRILGTLLAYFLVILIFPHIDDKLVLGALIVASSAGIPVFVGGNYTCMTFFITCYILFVLDWLMRAYGGDYSILIWRIWDTLMAAGWVAFGLGVLYLWEKYQKKATLGPPSQETRIDKN